jgi:hypothetical protein
VIEHPEVVPAQIRGTQLPDRLRGRTGPNQHTQRNVATPTETTRCAILDRHICAIFTRRCHLRMSLRRK